jgi:hypothetical protein
MSTAMWIGVAIAIVVGGGIAYVALRGEFRK